MWRQLPPSRSARASERQRADFTILASHVSTSVAVASNQLTGRAVRSFNPPPQPKPSKADRPSCVPQDPQRNPAGQTNGTGNDWNQEKRVSSVKSGILDHGVASFSVSLGEHPHVFWLRHLGPEKDSYCVSPPCSPSPRSPCETKAPEVREDACNSFIASWSCIFHRTNSYTNNRHMVCSSVLVSWCGCWLYWRIELEPTWMLLAKLGG